MKHRAEKTVGILAVIILVICQSGSELRAQVPPAQGKEETIEIVVERNVRVSATGGPFVEPTVSADPTDANVLIASSSEVVPDGIIAWAFRSEDSGRTWSAVPLPDMREGLARSDYVHALDTWTAFAPNGTAYLSVLVPRTMRAGSRETHIVVYRSTDHGRTWTGPMLTPGGHFDRPAMIATNDKVFIEVSAFGRDAAVVKQPIRANIIALLRSDDQGRSFQSMGYVAPDNLGHNSLNMSLLPDNSLLISYYDHPLNMEGQHVAGGRLYVAKVTDEGRSIGLPQFVSDANRVSNPGHIAVDLSDGPFRGRVYAAWDSGNLGYLNPSNVRSPTNTGKGREVSVSYSTDEGANWTQAVVLRAEDAGPAYYANVEVNRDGVVGVAWLQHERSEPERLCYRIYFAASIDGGKSFTPPHLVSDTVSCPDAKGNLVKINSTPDTVTERFPRGGDYFGLAPSVDGRFHVVWADSRNGSFQVYHAGIEVRRSGKTKQGAR